MVPRVTSVMLSATQAAAVIHLVTGPSWSES
jgi:hypothetical protein